nr:hypothetical protein [Streptomyces torulosus]
MRGDGHCLGLSFGSGPGLRKLCLQLAYEGRYAAAEVLDLLVVVEEAQQEEVDAELLVLLVTSPPLTLGTQ